MTTGQDEETIPEGQSEPSLTGIAGQHPYARIALIEAAQTMPGWQEMPPATASHLLSDLCLSYADELRYEEAIATGQRALRVATEQAADDPAVHGLALLHLGVAHARSGDVAIALQLYLEAASHARECGDEQTLRNASKNILLCLELGQPIGDRELSFLPNCMRWFESAGLLSEAIRACALIGEALIARRRPVEAIAALDRVLELTQPLGSVRDIRQKSLQLLQDADTMLVTEQAAAPPIGPGARGAVRALVDDGVDSIEHRHDARAVTCFKRALALLDRRSNDGERALAAFLLLMLSRLTEAGHAEDSRWAAEGDLKMSFAWFGKAMEELKLIDVRLGYWVKAREQAGDLHDLRMLAYAVAQGPGPRRRWGRRR